MDELDALVAAAMARFNTLTPEEQALHRKLQQESWVRAEIELSRRPRYEAS